MIRPEITVVIPAYNTSSYISDSINSILKQTFLNWELIVVNDGSTDNTGEIVQSFLSERRIKYIYQQNKGVSATRNVGIRTAFSDYITFLDADDYYLPNNLERKIEFIKRNPEIDFVYSDIIRSDLNLSEKYVEKAVKPEDISSKVWRQDIIPGLSSNIMVKKEWIKNGFLFDENLSNCADKYMKIILTKYAKGGYITEPIVKYRDTPGSMSKNVKLLENDEIYIVKKIVENNILPAGKFRRKIIADTYFMLSGSWYKDGHDSWRAVLLGIKAILIYPPLLFKLLSKLLP